MDVQALISQLGFPAFVAIWMLVKTSKDTESMRNAINELTNAINVLSGKDGGRSHE